MDQSQNQLPDQSSRLSQNLLDQILAETYTQSDALRRIRQIRSYLAQSLFSNSKDLSSLDPKDLNWMYQLGENFYKQFNKTNIYPIIEYFESWVRQAQILIIYIPFELPDSELTGLAKYVRNNFTERFLIEFKFDPELIGGCALVWKGVYKDYSVKQQIKNNQQALTSTFHQYFRR